MGDVAQVLSLSNDEAAQWNRDLLLSFHAALEKDPAVDFLSLVSESYIREHRNAQYSKLSYAGQINFRIINELCGTLKREPEVNLLSTIPRNYNRRIQMATGPTVESLAEQEKIINQGPLEFRARLDLAETATVVFALSEEVAALLGRHPGITDDNNETERSLAVSLKKLLWDAPKLWECPVRGVVVKCNDDIVAKVITGNSDYTEYTSMQYLAEKAPDIPAPRPHGLIALGPFRVIFMSYIGDMTLEEAWPNLSHEGKLSIQRQLDGIFRRLRTIQQDDGSMLGGVCEEGVKEFHVDECALFKDITSANRYSDLQFSARHHGSNTYIKFLRSFLENENAAMRGSVFTHGDVRMANIMVKRDPDNNDAYIVTGIIDWEDSGFYPAYYECTTLTTNLSVRDENDWYLYVPESISPLQFPVRWLVDRLWTIHLKTV